MNKDDLFRKSLESEKWRYLNWRLSVFNLSILPDDHKPEELDLNYIDDYAHVYLDGKWEKVEGAIKGEALYSPNDTIGFERGFWGDEGDTVTTYGRALANYTLWNFSFGKRFPFVNENIMPDKWLKKRIHLLVDDDKVPESGDYITATELGKFTQGILELKCLAPHITSTGSQITLTTHPEMDSTRERLIEEAGDEITKPYKVAEIIGKLDKLDEEWLSQDHSLQYYGTEKSRNRRRKLFAIEGVSSAFKEDGTFVLQDTPLLSRWKKKDLVAKYNETREGSYQRGSETAKGGEKVVFLQSTFQNHRVIEGNCGAKPLNVEINDFNFNQYEGLNGIVDGKLQTLTSDMLKEHIGKTLPIRRSFLCKTDHIDTCSTCASIKYAAEPRAIANEESSIGSYIMYGAMSAMHATDLKVAEFNVNFHLT